ncbi:hypothetical protein COCSUDRAFT_53867 [Coccomyxa subellipsoidea C-169]|uniref:Uncharacterized protein n=1 Tax=Coccomyxa subellipsoidea (strain C-169) TaxID=574566 RepID=I0YTV8_COCSC|nr:hypothetical protein COCSUDRAFT_53867 [Coccomyxa subellipsoidea C-169]EIE21827.1 hypothetical protein COCSUDRAFT_53867 [Coccomyxa subellipsoidea C-169]|eukprot:XP_005646371.1 hypothetical protein COCSUDRAFT_53867 [Coccomyxa subellipsoidea C-169]
MAHLLWHVALPCDLLGCPFLQRCRAPDEPQENMQSNGNSSILSSRLNLAASPLPGLSDCLWSDLKYFSFLTVSIRHLLLLQLSAACSKCRVCAYASDRGFKY